MNGNAVATHSNRLSMVYGPDQRTRHGDGEDDVAKIPNFGHPVPDRLSYVVTRNPNNCPEADGVIQGDIVQRILDLQHAHQDKTIWIIGGATLIEATLAIIDEFVLSRIPGSLGATDFYHWRI